MSFEKNIGKQLNFQKELDEASFNQEKAKPKAVSRGEKDDPWDDLGPNYEEQKRSLKIRKEKEKEEEKQRKKDSRENDKIKRRNYDNRY